MKIPKFYKISKCINKLNISSKPAHRLKQCYVFNLFCQPIKTMLLGTECVFKLQDLQMIDRSQKNMGHFHTLGIVGRSRHGRVETQLQVGENFNYLTSRFKG